MLFIIIPLAFLCAVLLWWAKRRSEPSDTLGWMSERWLAAHRGAGQFAAVHYGTDAAGQKGHDG